VPLAEALSLAREAGVDLVEVDPHGSPPVCRLLDYGKWKYQQAKKERDARKHQRSAVVHEVRLRPRIGQHDMERKVRTAERLLSAGDKVKVTIMYRGREMSHAELGRELLGKVIESLKGKATAERLPSMEGRRLSVIMAPTNKKPAPKPEATPEEETAVQA
jgi:translation initiation factor IF-3